MHEMEPGQVTTNDHVDSYANASEEQHEHLNVTPQRGIDTARAQSYQIEELCDKDETVMANALQGSERSNGDPANSHTNDTPAVDSQSQDPTNTDDGSSDLEEDSDYDDSEENALVDEPEALPYTVKARARKASGAHSNALITPRKRRKVSSDLVKQLTSTVAKGIPESLI
jgi:hypothetical protein